MNFVVAIGGVLSILFSFSISAVMSYLPQLVSEFGLAGTEVEMILSELSGLYGIFMIGAIPQVLGVITVICINIALIKLRKKFKQIFAY